MDQPEVDWQRCVGEEMYWRAVRLTLQQALQTRSPAGLSLAGLPPSSQLAPSAPESRGRRAKVFRQETLVALTALLLFVAFSLVLPKFFTIANCLLLLKNISVLAILAIAMAIVVIGRGIDLSQVAVLAITSAWTISLIADGKPLGLAILLGFFLALAFGMANGVLVAYAEIPSVIATLAFGLIVGGFGRYALLSQSLIQVPDDQHFIYWLGQGKFAGLATSVVIFLLLLGAFAFLMRLTTYGRFIYAIGDNYDAARITGLNVRPIVVSQYAVCAAVTYIAGLVLAGNVGSVNQTVVTGAMIFDVLTVVVVGGISLVGGRGGAFSIICGVALVGVLLNGLVIMNVQTDVQNILKSFVLLAAIVADTLINPRDEETAKQGDL
jgi:ribose transport system permease protein